MLWNYFNQMQDIKFILNVEKWSCLTIYSQFQAPNPKVDG
jgi:hypothetical protein